MGAPTTVNLSGGSQGSEGRQFIHSALEISGVIIRVLRWETTPMIKLRKSLRCRPSGTKNSSGRYAVTCLVSDGGAVSGEVAQRFVGCGAQFEDDVATIRYLGMRNPESVQMLAID
jgi:hypothetical protein